MRLNSNSHRARAADRDRPVGRAGRPAGGGLPGHPAAGQRGHGGWRRCWRAAWTWRCSCWSAGGSASCCGRGAAGRGQGPGLRGRDADGDGDPEGHRLRAAGGRPLVEPVRRPAEREAGPRSPDRGDRGAVLRRSAPPARWRCWPSAPGRCWTGQLSLGAMLALAAVAGGFLEPLSNLVQTLPSLETGARLPRPGQRRAAGRARAAARGPALAAPARPGASTLEQVSLPLRPAGAAGGATRSACDIAPGQFVAIVGPLGLGQDHPGQPAPGPVHRPATGRVLFDGDRSARELDLRSVRQQFGVVNQNLALFGATIRDNIALADPACRLADGRARRPGWPACTTTSPPSRWATTRRCSIGAAPSRAGSGSGWPWPGRWSARPAILLLDEATSALDAATERQVQQSLDGAALHPHRHRPPPEHGQATPT